MQVKKIKDFGFVHFTTRAAADETRQKMNGSVLEGAELEVIWAKPPDRSIMKSVREAIKTGHKGAHGSGSTPYSVCSIEEELLELHLRRFRQRPAPQRQ